MAETINDVPILLRREIEALMIKPFLQVFERELGHEKTFELAAKAISIIAEESGAEAARMLGSNGPPSKRKRKDGEKKDEVPDGVTSEREWLDENTQLTTIHKCEYIEMYDRIGMREYGYLLSCLRDEYFYKGFNKDTVMERTQTLMTGGDCCDFCVHWPPEEKTEEAEG